MAAKSYIIELVYVEVKTKVEEKISDKRFIHKVYQAKALMFHVQNCVNCHFHHIQIDQLGSKPSY